MQRATRIPSVVVMGVQGSGKSTIGRAVAERFGLEFREGDDLHSAANRAKMARGEPLTDDDRTPWLRRVGEVIADDRAAGSSTVVACSALKRSYRDLLRDSDPELVFVHLHGSRSLLEQRLAARHHEYMPVQLLESQLATLEPLEPDERGLVVDIALDPDHVMAEIAHWIDADATATEVGH